MTGLRRGWGPSPPPGRMLLKWDIPTRPHPARDRKLTNVAYTKKRKTGPRPSQHSSPQPAAVASVCDIRVSQSFIVCTAFSFERLAVLVCSAFSSLTLLKARGVEVGPGWF